MHHLKETKQREPPSAGSKAGRDWQAAVEVRAQAEAGDIGIVAGELELDRAAELLEALAAAQLVVGRAEWSPQHVLGSAFASAGFLERDNRIESAFFQIGA